MEGLEIIESGRRMPSKTSANNNSGVKQPLVATKTDKALDALSDNFGTILELAGSIIEIKRMQVASEALLKKMEEDRKRITDEAQAYAVKKRADTSSVVERMNVIRSMMQDFYVHNDGNLSGDDFCKIITEVVNQMGRVEDGIR